MAYYKIDSGGNSTPEEPKGQLVPQETKGTVAAFTVRVEDAGKTFALIASQGAAITLPAVVNGFKVRFAVGRAFATASWVITIPTAVGYGGSIVNSVLVPASANNTITLVAGSATIGDYIDFEVSPAAVAGGYMYSISGNFAQAGAATFTTG